MLFITKFTAIIIGSLFLAVGINFFLVPFKVIDGGVIGLALIAKYMWGLKTGLTIIFCSIPIYIVAWFRSVIFSSVVYIVCWISHESLYSERSEG
jgi:uncharacterized membrane-anchored protein YitT (DUF2179 family)